MSRKDAKDAKQRILVEPSLETERVAHLLIGAAIEVHRSLGPGYTESIYERALAIELEHCAIPFLRQVALAVTHRGVVVGDYRLDLVVDECLIVELKSVESLNTTHRSQVISYLKAAQLDLGLLINFNVPVLQQGIRRVVRSL